MLERANDPRPIETAFTSSSSSANRRYTRTVGILLSLLMLIGLWSDTALTEEAHKVSRTVITRSPLSIVAERTGDGNLTIRGTVAEGGAGLSVHSPSLERIENPNRLIIDLPGLQVRKQGGNERLPTELTHGLRFGIHPDKTRIVVDLKEHAVGFVSRGTVDQFEVTVTRVDNAVSVSAQPVGAATPPLLLSEPMILDAKRGTVPHAPPLESKSEFAVAAPPQSSEMPRQAESVFWSEQSVIRIAHGEPPVVNLQVTNVHTAPMAAMVRARELSPPESSGAELLVSPRRFTLGPGESRLLRIVNRAASANRDRVFQVLVASSTNVSELRGGNETTLSTVVVEPPNPQRKLSWELLEAGKVRIRNDGNTAVDIVSGQFLSGESSRDVDALRDKTILVGESFEVAAEQDKDLRIIYRDGVRVHQLKITL